MTSLVYPTLLCIGCVRWNQKDHVAVACEFDDLMPLYKRKDKYHNKVTRSNETNIKR